MNILMLTSVFPLSDDNDKKGTKVVNYFVTEWAKLGHKVTVIHNVHRFPALIHKLPHIIKDKIAAKAGFHIADYCDVIEKQRYSNGVSVFRLPIKKFIPHKEPSKRAIKRQTVRIVSILNKENFVPDIIMGHWASPQMAIIHELKKIYGCKTSLVLHGPGYYDSPEFKSQLGSIDYLWCRSETESNKVQATLNLAAKPFVCYSGIPDDFVKKFTFNPNKFGTLYKKCKLIYVGRLVSYKNVDKVLLALSKADFDFSFDIVGDGGEKEHLVSLAKELKIADKVFFHGRLSRESVLELMNESHVFVMISKGEVFGLVYLEAMCSSCIVIGSKREGIDGIVLDKKNGFLCEAGDDRELLSILKEIQKMNSFEMIRMAQNGYVTASNFSDSKVADDYLNVVRGVKC